MSYKFTLKDALLEAGARDYRDESEDKSWIPSEKLRKDMDKLTKKRGGKGASGIVFKVAAIAASVLLISGAILTLKPVRKALSGTGDKTDTAPVTVPSTGGQAYNAAESTESRQTAASGTESVAEPTIPSTDQTGDPYAPLDEIGVYLLLLGAEKSNAVRDFLYAPEREATVCGYCISVLTEPGASKELKNGAAHFLHGLNGFVSPLFAMKITCPSPTC